MRYTVQLSSQSRWISSLGYLKTVWSNFHLIICPKYYQQKDKKTPPQWIVSIISLSRLSCVIMMSSYILHMISGLYIFASRKTAHPISRPPHTNQCCCGVVLRNPQRKPYVSTCTRMTLSLSVLLETSNMKHQNSSSFFPFP